VNFIAPPLGTTVAFLLVIFAVQGMLLYAVHKAGSARATGFTAAGFVVVMVVTTLLAQSGVMARQTMPTPTMMYFAICNLTAAALALSRPGRVLAAAVVPAFWLLFQGFRLPLEVILHLWQEAGTVPLQMSWSGQNLDVISGIAGLLLGLILLKRPTARWAGWLGHAVGLGLLANVARIALLSVPSPFRTFEDPLLLPFHAPYLWILPFAVSAALFTHIVGLRALMRPPSA